jgi:eukaryotic-like serine/threonine-protein kinase
MTLSAGTRLGAYEILAPIGAGGMGEVFRARDTRLGREVALKVLPEALAQDRERLARFEQEARAASALNHPNIVTIHEIGREGETAFIAMELVDGKTLRELEAPGPLPVRRILNVTAQVAEGLAKAHAAGIVHRDLKPENVMVSKDGFVKILDFGLAKLVEPQSGEVSAMPTLAKPETHAGMVLGTVAYMSPEQASGEPLDYRSDQFSLGSMLYEMSTGQKAFQRKTAAETMSAIIREEPEPVGKLRPELPLPLRWMLERCLAKDREERYAATKDLARDLASVRDHISEVSSGAEAMLAAAGRPRRRIAPLLLGIALAAALILAGWVAARAWSGGPPPAPSFRRLTFRQGQLGNARFAPDGQTVVYGARWQRDPEGMQLYQTLVGSPESRAFDFRGDILAISPSNELAIIRFADDLGTLARVPMSGGTPREVLENVAYAGADFSPDGRELAVAHVVDGKSRLEFPAGKVLVSEGAQAPRFSPDGETIAFWDFAADRISLGLVDRHGKSKRAIATDFAGFAGAPCWRPDGREVWVTASGPGELDALWAVDMSGRRRLVMRVPGSLELDDISRDGRVLLAHHTLVRTLRGGSATDTKARDLSWLDSSLAADLSADGKTLLIQENGEGSAPDPVVYLRGMDGSPAARLGKGVARALSPDGKWVLASTPPAEGKTENLLLLPTGPGDERVLDRNGLAEFGWGGWLPDGRSVVFSAAPAGGASRLWIQAVPEGKPRPISPEGIGIQDWTNPVSPDGRFVVGFRGGTALLFPLDGAGEPRVVPGVDPRVDRVVQWTRDMSALYVGRITEWPIKVFLLDLETGQKRLFRQIEEEQPYRGWYVRVTPDGNAWAYSAGHVLSELYLVEGLR